jgi:hypothetical protein
MPDGKVTLLLNHCAHARTYAGQAEELSLIAGYPVTIRQVHAVITNTIKALYGYVSQAGAVFPEHPEDCISERQFEHYSRIHFATDGCNFPLEKPMVNPRLYISGHKGISDKCIITTNTEGHVVHVTETSPGSHHDFYQVKSTLGVGCKKTLKSFMHRRNGGRFPVLADGGFRGIRKLLPHSKLPIRKPPHGELTDLEREKNRDLAHDRIIIENFNGRRRVLWKILRIPYRGDRDQHAMLVTILVWLTSEHIKRHPLRIDQAELDDGGDASSSEGDEYEGTSSEDDQGSD